MHVYLMQSANAYRRASFAVLHISYRRHLHLTVPKASTSLGTIPQRRRTTPVKSQKRFVCTYADCDKSFSTYVQSTIKGTCTRASCDTPLTCARSCCHACLVDHHFGNSSGHLARHTRIHTGVFRLQVTHSIAEACKAALD